MKKKIMCETCGAQTKELFEKGSKWVCKNCKEPTNLRGHIVKTKPPAGIGRGTMLDHSKGN